MAKAKSFETKEGGTNRDLGTYVWIFCPGCQSNHRLRIRMPAHPTAQEIADQKNNVHGLWTFNGNHEQPTFNPSLLVWASEPSLRCHSFIRDGNIQFLSDCGHSLKNKTVELPDIQI